MQRIIEWKQAGIEAQTTVLRTSLESEKDEPERAIVRDKLHQDTLAENTRSMNVSR